MTPVQDPFMSGQRPRYIGPELRGPADADGFRVKVGRYGDRWYHDPLSGCHVAAAWDGVVPSVSTVKKASGNDWTYTGLKRVNNAIETIPQYRRLDLMPYEHRGEALVAINKLGLKAAGARGTNVHLMFDAMLHGQPSPVTEGMPGYEYTGAVEQFFQQYNPTLVAAEFVCIHRTLNGVGYGGTADAIIELDGLMSRRMRCLVDWKSRGVDSDHGAYPEEAAQVSGYHGADYIIVEGRDGPERRLMPELDGGLIVSIKPDGCRVYPVDLDKGFAHWSALHAWWVARSDEREAIGRQWPARKNVGVGDRGTATPTPAPDVAGECLATEADRMPSSDPSPSTPTVEGEVSDCLTASPSKPAPSTSVSPQATQSPAAVNAGAGGSADPTRLPAVEWPDVENFVPAPAEALAWASQPAPAPLPALPANPDEGRPATTRRADSLFELLESEYNTLAVTNPAARAWVSRLTVEAQQANVGFHTSGGRRTERRFHLIRGLVTLAQNGSPDDDVLRALVTAALHNDAPLDPRHTPGACVGSLDAAAAQRFATLVDQYVGTTV